MSAPRRRAEGDGVAARCAVLSAATCVAPAGGEEGCGVATNAVVTTPTSEGDGWPVRVLATARGSLGAAPMHGAERDACTVPRETDGWPVRVLATARGSLGAERDALSCGAVDGAGGAGAGGAGAVDGAGGACSEYEDAGGNGHSPSGNGHATVGELWALVRAELSADGGELQGAESSAMAT